MILGHDGKKLLNREVEIIEEEVVLGTGEHAYLFKLKNCQIGIAVNKDDLDSGRVSRRDACDAVISDFEAMFEAASAQ